MNRKEALLAQCIVEMWPLGLGDVFFSHCSLPVVKVDIRRNVRLPATDVAWREFDLLTDVFQFSDYPTRLVIELKNGGIGYGSIGQVLFYKHVLAPRHYNRLGVTRLIFVVVGKHPNSKRWFGKGNLESDAEEFLKLLKPEYWPDPDIHVLSYNQLGLQYDITSATWNWRK